MGVGTVPEMLVLLSEQLDALYTLEGVCLEASLKTLAYIYIDRSCV